MSIVYSLVLCYPIFFEVNFVLFKYRQHTGKEPLSITQVMTDQKTRYGTVTTFRVLMRRFFVILILFSFSFCSAQNYQCLQGGAKHYFVNGNGYLRGIRIDSVRAVGDTTVYYPNHTPRGAYAATGSMVSLNANGGSWLGRRVLQKSYGTFIFDSYWNDSVVIKSRANISDSWVFYKDTSSLYYKATLIAKDTLTVLSVLDSVETITINAYNGSGIVTTDPLNGFTIILSKNHGFVQVFDLYTFPYHKADSVYRPGMDFFLDRSTCNYSNINTAAGTAPNSSATIFTLTDFVSPNDQQLHNWNVNDIIGSYHSFTAYPYTGSYTYTNYFSDTVATKVVAGHVVTYAVTGSAYTCSDISDPCELIIIPRAYTFYDTVYTIADTGFIPEENLLAPNYVFYFPGDTSQCVLGPEYIAVPAYYSVGSTRPIRHYTYKRGIGQLYNQFSYADRLLLEWNGLSYTYLNGNACGVADPAGVNNTMLANNTIILFPDPATTLLTISATDKINSIIVTNLFGQTVYSHSYAAEKVQIDVAPLPSGTYFVKVNGSEIRRFVKQ